MWVLRWSTYAYISVSLSICPHIHLSMGENRNTWKEKVVSFPYLHNIIAFEKPTVNVKVKIWTCEAEI